MHKVHNCMKTISLKLLQRRKEALHKLRYILRKIINNCCRFCSWVYRTASIYLLIAIPSAFLIAWFISQASRSAFDLRKDAGFLWFFAFISFAIFVVGKFIKYSYINWIRCGKSFVPLVYLVAIFTPWALMLLGKCEHIKDGFGVYRHYQIGWYGACIASSIPLLICLGSALFYKCKKPLMRLKWRFAADAIGKDDDALNISPSARNYALGIRDAAAYVSVYGLYGGMGQGKSSFARMIVEWLVDREVLGHQRILYTYISLTETNEARDLSKLFAERWSETLSERYPRINTPNFFSTLKSIFRDSEPGWTRSLLAFLDNFNVPLFSMTVKQRDISVPEVHQHITKEMGMLFGFIPRIHEDLWLIMIDEIERATLDEIYRLVEIIERFKAEGRTGVPVKIVFLLCIAYDELRRYLHDFKAQDARAYLLSDFFIANPKNIMQTIYLPPSSDDAREGLIIHKLKNAFDLARVPQDEIWEGFKPSELISPRHEFISEKKKALEYAVAFVARKSPRVIMRCISEMEAFYRSFRDNDASSKTDAIRECDILILSYLRLTCPQVIEFLRQTVGDLLPGDHFSRRILDRIVKKDESEEYTLAQWIKDTVDWDVGTKGDEILEIVGLSARAWIDHLERASHIRDHQYDGSTSDASTMKDYLMMVLDEGNNIYRWVKGVYKQHKAGNNVIKDESSIDNVLMYAQRIRNYENVEINILQDVMDVLYHWLVSGKIEVSKCDVGSTYYDGYITYFAFYITEIIERMPDEVDSSKVYDHIWACIQGVLTAAHIPLGVKYMLVSDFLYQRGGDIHFRMVAAFKKIIQTIGVKAVLETMQTVFDQRDRDYYKGDEILYEHEENFFYTLYQGWSGDANRNDEIQNIRDVAARQLEKYSKAIELYWNQYPAGSKSAIFSKFEDWHKRGTELYLPLENLIEVTKKAEGVSDTILEKMHVWESIWQDDKDRKRYEEWSKIGNDSNTLYAVFIRSKNESEPKEGVT